MLSTVTFGAATVASIAYVDHSFHQKTRSTAFLPKILRDAGHEVVEFWDDSWRNGTPVAWKDIRGFDVVVMFQVLVECEANYYSRVHDNVIFVPMLDQFGIWQGPLFNVPRYLERLHGSKMLNFSGSLHCLATAMGIRSEWFRYFPEPSFRDYDFSRLHAFFWLRRQSEIPWSRVRSLVSTLPLQSMHVHVAGDPGYPNPIAPTAEGERYSLKTSTWFKDHVDYMQAVQEANIFLAPRMEEGIGQAFLEAMARGQVVIAPNNGTMNEYLVSGVNGLLYDERTTSLPANIDFESLAVSSRRTVLHGYQKWVSDQKRLVDYVISPSRNLYQRMYAHDYTLDLTTLSTSLRSHLVRFARRTRLGRFIARRLR